MPVNASSAKFSKYRLKLSSAALRYVPAVFIGYVLLLAGGYGIWGMLIGMGLNRRDYYVIASTVLLCWLAAIWLLIHIAVSVAK